MGPHFLQQWMEQKKRFGDQQPTLLCLESEVLLWQFTPAEHVIRQPSVAAAATHSGVWIISSSRMDRWWADRLIGQAVNHITVMSRRIKRCICYSRLTQSLAPSLTPRTTTVILYIYRKLMYNLILSAHRYNEPNMCDLFNNVLL